jgi:hypothetical protein
MGRRKKVFSTFVYVVITEYKAMVSRVFVLHIQMQAISFAVGIIHLTFHL